MYILQDELKLNEWQFSQRKYLPYEMKVKLAETRFKNGMKTGMEMCTLVTLGAWIVRHCCI